MMKLEEFSTKLKSRNNIWMSFAGFANNNLFQHSAWNDTSAPNRPALAQVEIKPTVRIMRRDTNPENEQKKPDSPEIAKQ